MKSLIGLLVAAFAATANASVNHGMYTGKNENAWYWNGCSVEMFGAAEGSFDEITVSDARYTYRFKMENAVFQPGHQAGQWTFSDQVAYKNKSGGLWIYTNQTARTAELDVVTLVVSVNEEGTPHSYMVEHNSNVKRKLLNWIKCEKLARF